MADIIVIENATPYFRPNYAYFVDWMEKEGIEIIINDRDEVISWRSAARSKGIVMIAEKVDQKTWKIKLAKNKTELTAFSEKIELLKQGQEVHAVNRGQALKIMQDYKKVYPQEHRELKAKRINKEKWCIWLEETI